VPNQIKSNQIY